MAVHPLARMSRTPISRARSAFYLLVCGVVGVEFLLLALLDFELGGAITPKFLLAWAMIAAASLLARSYGLARIADTLDALAIPQAIGLVSVLTTILIATQSHGFIDSKLVAADAALGFDFRVAVRWVAGIPLLQKVSNVVYVTSALQTMLLPLALALAGRARDLRIFIAAWTLSLAVTSLTFYFTPTEGPYAYWGIQFHDIPSLRRFFAWEFGKVIAGLQDGSLRHLADVEIGLVSLPSFHTIGAILCAWAALRFGRWGWPIVALNLLVVASTIPSGAHYLIDVIAGIAVAFVVLWLVTRLVDYALAAHPHQPPGPGAESSGQPAIETAPIPD